MKNLLYLALIGILCATPLMAQKNTPPPPESKPDLELTCDEANARIEQYQNKIDALNQRLSEAKNGVELTEAELEKVTKELFDCEEEILRLIGATKEDLEAFRQRLGVLEGKVRQMKNLPNDVLADRRAEVVELENELNELRNNRLSVIPEFYDRIIALAKDIRGLYREKKIDGYVVGTWAQDRDCLWNIAGKTEIYGDPMQWPKIWQANTDIIRNPDIIHPGQVLKILPAGPKTDEETKAERRYWRNKRAVETE